MERFVPRPSSPYLRWYVCEPGFYRTPVPAALTLPGYSIAVLDRDGCWWACGSFLAVYGHEPQPPNAIYPHTDLPWWEQGWNRALSKAWGITTLQGAFDHLYKRADYNDRYTSATHVVLS